MRQVKRLLFACAISILTAACATHQVNVPSQDGKLVKSGLAPLHGIKLYYEIHGFGGSTPLVLLNGGGVAMQVAIRHPKKIRKLVFVSYMTKRKGAYPWM